MNTCKFCGFTWDFDRPCEYSCDSETGTVVYCGSQECPTCLFCQSGPAPEPTLVAVALKIRLTKDKQILRTPW